MKLNETIQIILILLPLMTLFIPMVIEIIRLARENRRLDQEARERARNRATQHNG